MAKTVYVNRLIGNNSWDGLSPTFTGGSNGPKATIAGARAATASGDLVLIAPGVYTESYIAFTASTDHMVLYRRDPTKPGKVIVDFENFTNRYFYCTWNYWTAFLDIHFRNPAPGQWFILQNDGLSRFYHCVFYQRDGTPNTGYGFRYYNSPNNDAAIFNCTFYNLAVGLYDITVSPAYGNHFVNCTTPLYSVAGTRNNNAYPGNTETNGIDTNVTDVDLIDPANDDLRLDPTDPDWSTFIGGGYRGGRIGSFGNGFYYNSELAQLRYLSPDPTPANGNPQLQWENEGPSGTGTYTSGVPGDIIENATTKELEIDLVTTPGATGGRVRSDVMSMGGTNTVIRAISYSGSEDPASGYALDIDDTLPFQEEYRSSTTPFAKGDALPAWQPYTRTTNIAQSGDEYVQFRMEFRTGHTNA